MKNREPLLSVTIKDCRVDVMRSSKGAGGQHRDKTSSAVRVTHIASGATGFSQEYREQPRNKKLAFRRMAESDSFNAWIRMTVAGLEPIDAIVDRAMAPENLAIEYL